MGSWRESEATTTRGGGFLVGQPGGERRFRFGPRETVDTPKRTLEGRPAIEAARWTARSQSRSQLPDVAVYGQLHDDRNALSGGSQTGVLGAMVRWNAFDATRPKRLAVAGAEKRAAEQSQRAARDQVRLEVEMAWRRAQAARERYAAAAGGAEEGREALRVVQERRQSGMATLTDELETEVASLAAELREIEAASDAAIADAALRRAAGEL